MVLSCSDLAKHYGDKAVFAGVGLTLKAGRVLLVVGENGAGKSTLLRVLSGLAAPTAGAVERAAPPERTGFLGHRTFLYPRLSAVDNLRFWARLYGLPSAEDDVLPVLERMGLTHAAFEEAGSFSRGMAQRLSLARVLLPEPVLIFLDEPATGLDKASRKVLRDEIAAARERGAALVWVSHDLAGDLPMADAVLELAGPRKGGGSRCLAASDYAAEAVRPETEAAC